MPNVDLSPIRDVVEGVIARHERYIGYGKAREARSKARLSMKIQAIAKANIDAIRAWEGHPLWAILGTAQAEACTAQIQRKHHRLFCTDKPEVDSRRLAAYRRATRVQVVDICRKPHPETGRIVLEITQ